jgi:hypothetical protein
VEESAQTVVLLRIDAAGCQLNQNLAKLSSLQDDSTSGRAFAMKQKVGMKGLVSVDDLMAAMPEKRRKDIEARGAALVAKIRLRMILKEFRKDPRFSTMQRTVEAMGGKLTMLVTFQDKEPVVLVTRRGRGK